MPDIVTLEELDDRERRREYALFALPEKLRPYRADRDEVLRLIATVRKLYEALSALVSHESASDWPWSDGLWRRAINLVDRMEGKRFTGNLQLTGADDAEEKGQEE